MRNVRIKIKDEIMYDGMMDDLDLGINMWTKTTKRVQNPIARRIVQQIRNPVLDEFREKRVDKI